MKGMTIAAATARWCCLLRRTYIASFQSSYRYFHHHYSILEIDKIRLVIEGPSQDHRADRRWSQNSDIVASKVLVISKKTAPSPSHHF